MTSKRENSIVYSYESLVDYNVFHIKKDSNGTLYVQVKYDLDDIMEEHVYERNPLNVYEGNYSVCTYSVYCTNSIIS